LGRSGVGAGRHKAFQEAIWSSGFINNDSTKLSNLSSILSNEYPFERIRNLDPVKNKRQSTGNYAFHTEIEMLATEQIDLKPFDSERW